jgi:hypothetical protein
VLLTGMVGMGANSLNAPALAHRAKAGVTTIEWNARTEMLEVIHRLHAHDAQVAVADVMGVHPPDLGDLKPRAALALYVSQTFTLAGEDGATIPLDIVGAEIEGAYVYIYQEAALPALPGSLLVTNNILIDVFRNQMNTVNVKSPTGVKSAEFSHDVRKTVLDMAQ